MKFFFTYLVLGALMLECAIFFYQYGTGNNGYKKIQELRTQHEHLKQAVEESRSAVNGLEKEINDFEKYPYYKEQIIREKLQMLKPNEVIYKHPKN